MPQDIDEKIETSEKVKDNIEAKDEEKDEHLTPAQERESIISNIGEKKEPEEIEETTENIEETKPSKPDAFESLTEKIIVDGQEREVPLSDILDAGKRTLQKETAADSRLEEATRLLKEATQKTSLPEKSDEKIETPDDKDASEIRIKELTEAIQYGDENEAAAALKEIMSDQPQQFTMDEVKSQIKEELRVEQINERLKALPEDGGFGDLTEDPKLIALANQAIDKALADGSPYTWELCKKACQSVRIWVDSFKPEIQQPKDELQEKRERKKSIDEVKGTNIKNIKITKEARPQTTSEIVAEMRKIRGQA